MRDSCEQILTGRESVGGSKFINITDLFKSLAFFELLPGLCFPFHIWNLQEGEVSYAHRHREGGMFISQIKDADFQSKSRREPPMRDLGRKGPSRHPVSVCKAYVLTFQSLALTGQQSTEKTLKLSARCPPLINLSQVQPKGRKCGGRSWTGKHNQHLTNQGFLSPWEQNWSALASCVQVKNQ